MDHPGRLGMDEAVRLVGSTMIHLSDFVRSTRGSPVRHRGFGEVLRTMKSVFGKEGKLLGLSIEMLKLVDVLLFFLRVLNT